MISGKIVWITGGGSGIGRATAIAFANGGGRVVVSGRKKKPILDAVKEITANGGVAVAAECDVRDEASVKTAIRAIEQTWGPVDILVNNAGVGPWKDFLKTTVKDFDECIATNLRGMFLCSQAVAPSMVKRGGGQIVNILSTASIRAFPGNSAYCASKFGGLGLTRVMRSELKKHNIRVIAILPGAVETPMWGADDRVKYHERMMQPDDIAQAIIDAVKLPDRAVVEEILLRPLSGDI